MFRLVEMIEGQYPRPVFPDVYLGLLAIHRGQCRSLDQQGGASRGDIDVLSISLAKGGSSVLADGYLVAGSLTDAEAEFLFGYGTLLQLLDDLQDVTADRAAGHVTIFSRVADGRPLDPVAIRLLNFMDRILEAGAVRFDGARCRSLWRAIRRNCIHLLLQAVANNRRLFTAKLASRIRRSPSPPWTS